MLTKVKAASFLDVGVERIREMGERDGATIVILDDYRKFILGQEGLLTAATPPASRPTQTGLVMTEKARRVTGSEPQS